MEKNKTILVTGGAGYIGSHACKLLKKEGFFPVCFDNLSVGHKASVKWGDLIQADLREKKEIEKALKNYKPAAVMHFAADALVGESMHNPGKYYENNVYSTINLLEAMVSCKVPYLIFSSTCAIYGIPKIVPISEKNLFNPINPYGRSKLMIENILDDYERAHNLKFASLRYFNAAGADLENEIGENHKNETHLIPCIMQTVLKIKPSMDIYGIDYPTSDGSAIRDYIHVHDLIDAHIKALYFLFKNQQSIKLNLGTGKGYSVLEIIKETKKIVKQDIKTTLQKRRAGDPPILLADNNKAKELLNWTPLYSDLPTIIKTAWNWHQKLSKGSI